VTPRTRRAALGGIIGPAAFIGTWSISGLLKARYSALHDPISELAAVHSSTRIAMTSAFVVFAIGMCFYARALRCAPVGPAWATAAASGLATLGVAAFPLHHSATIDRVHGVFAGTGYVTLAATALLSAAHLARLGLRSWSRLAGAAGAICGIALALTLAGPYEGFFQRLGLTAGDVWVMASSVALLRGYWTSASASRSISSSA
jgi:hypothetical membrane protein